MTAGGGTHSQGGSHSTVSLSQRQKSGTAPPVSSSLLTLEPSYFTSAGQASLCGSLEYYLLGDKQQAMLGSCCYCEMCFFLAYRKVLFIRDCSTKSVTEEATHPSHQADLTSFLIPVYVILLDHLQISCN